ncbi:MAG: FHA domain-containing protein [Planctomycetes bacterium]|nr:FHA domain-containing protein [Planctomycetota bacterium]
MKDPSKSQDSCSSCPDCGGTVAASARFCIKCGASVKEARPTPQPCPAPEERTPTRDPVLPLVGPNAPSDDLHSADCGSCDAELCANAKFCQECGVPVGEVRSVIRLTIRQPGKEPREMDLDGELLIGKNAECDLAIDDAYLSRRHCRIYAEDGVLYLEDLGSANGTFLRVRRLIELETGDEIVVGTTAITITEEDQA